MPIIQKYRDCKCTEECYDMFQESVHYDYYPLSPGQVGVMGPNDDTLVIMTEKLFWENFTDPKREHKHKKLIMDTLEFENRKEILQTAIDIRSMRLKLKEKLHHLASFAAYEFLAYQGCRIEVKAYRDDEYTIAEIIKGTVIEARSGNLIIALDNGGDRSIPLDRIKDIALYKC